MSADLFTYADTTIDVDPTVADSHRSVWEQLARSGTWWTAAEVAAISGRVRDTFGVRNLPPWSRDLPEGVDGLATETVAAIDQLVCDPGSIDGEWARSRVAELGEGHYVELIGILATVVMVDMFVACVGVDPEPLPVAATDPGRPSQERPAGLGDIGAHVPMLDPFPYANVARALSLVPSANALFRTTSVPMYSAPGMSDLVWDTPLSRPQVELIASRVAALNECFY